VSGGYEYYSSNTKSLQVVEVRAFSLDLGLNSGIQGLRNLRIEKNLSINPVIPKYLNTYVQDDSGEQ
jgi:hypothetical protein